MVEGGPGRCIVVPVDECEMERVKCKGYFTISCNDAQNLSTTTFSICIFNIYLYAFTSPGQATCFVCAIVQFEFVSDKALSTSPSTWQ